MRYQDFINETQGLIRIGEQIRAAQLTHDDSKFRSWRHRSESLVAETIALGYRLPGPYKSRKREYRAMYAGAPGAADIAALSKDIGDSLIELQFLVDQYRKYGEPKCTQLLEKAEPASALSEGKASRAKVEFPEKVTLVWLAKNVSIGFWWKVAIFLFGVFLLGAAAGQTALYKSVAEWVKAIWPK